MQTDVSNGFVIEARGISKVFPGVQALRDVDLTLSRGEVLAVVGENGAGKSTLMKILAGVEMESEGVIKVDGQQVRIGSVDKALDLGIALVHQELNLCPNLSIADNVFLGREKLVKSVGGLEKVVRLVDKETSEAETADLLKKVGLETRPDTLVRDLTIGSQQLVEIAKALSINAKVVIFDEPTSSLSGPETERLFAVIKDLKDHGVSVVYISHRLGEVKHVADRVLVLRDGEVTGQLSAEEITKEAMIHLMVGRDIEKFYSIKHKISDKVRLEVRDFIVPKQPGKPINLKVHAGEILVLAGLVGAGRTEFAQALYGIDQPWAGRIFIDGREVKVNDPIDAIRAGMLLVPEDRKLHGLVTEMDVVNNITLAGFKDRLSKYGIVDARQAREVASRMIKELDVRLHSMDQIVQTLSGGNQQKVVLGKWLSMDPKVLLLDEPTRGIDVVAKEEVYKLMERLAEEKVAMLVISSEMQEVLSIADRIVVMCEGTVTGELLPDQYSEENVIKLATETTRHG
ncbi:MAG: sugar ABC transporter ATP-binding protein [Spirochaetaceae bacterium]|nr:MAG: sugar ABC transporter ATP-binding protein [Spirochaetaceae bacterium]